MTAKYTNRRIDRAAVLRVTCAFLTLLTIWAVQDGVWLVWVCCQWLVYGIGWKYLSDRLCVLPALPTKCDNFFDLFAKC